MEQCRVCKTSRLFRNLPPSSLKDLRALMLHLNLPPRGMIFMEGEQPHGVYILCEGQVKLSIISSGGKGFTLRIAQPGEVLGLSAAIMDTAYEYSAESLHCVKAAFVRRDDFLHFLNRHVEACRGLAMELCSQYQESCDHFRTLALHRSVAAKLAKLLLDWSGAHGAVPVNGSRVDLPLTHGEIAELIGTTRETISRTFGDFRNRHLLAQRGVVLTIANRAGLEREVR
jgi:CRP/FNR family transcriptional regulator